MACALQAVPQFGPLKAEFVGLVGLFKGLVVVLHI